jgi:hypothetical protein
MHGDGCFTNRTKLIEITNQIKYKVMSDKEFCELYNSYTGEGGLFSGIDDPKQLTVNMTGDELKEWTEFVLKQANEQKETTSNCTMHDVSNNEVAVCCNCGKDKYLNAMTSDEGLCTCHIKVAN